MTLVVSFLASSAFAFAVMANLLGSLGAAVWGVVLALTAAVYGHYTIPQHGGGVV